MNSFGERVAAAEDHLRAGRFGKAGALYQEVLQTTPDQPDCLLGLGLVAMDAGKADKAIDLFQAALALRPDFAVAAANLALAYTSKGRVEEAETCFERALALEPDLPVATVNYIRLLIGRNELKKALGLAKALIEKAPDLPDAHVMLGLIFFHDGRYEAAEACLRKGLVLDSAHVEALKVLGLVLGEKRDLTEARASLEAALLQDPTNPELQVSMADVLVGLGEDREADALLQRARPTFGKAPWFLTAEARIRLRQGQVVPAMAAARQALRQAPKDARATALLVQALMAQGLSDAAIKTAERLAGLDGAEDGARYLKAFIMVREEAFDEGFSLMHRETSGGGQFWEAPLPPDRLSGKTIGVLAPGEMAEAIRYLRYVPLLAAAGAKVRLFAKGPVLELYKAFELPCRVLDRQLALTYAMDLSTSLERLPFLLSRSDDRLPTSPLSVMDKAAHAQPQPVFQSPGEPITVIGLPDPDDAQSDPAWLRRVAPKIETLDRPSGSIVRLGGTSWPVDTAIRSLSAMGAEETPASIAALLATADTFVGPASWKAELAGMLGLSGTVFVSCTGDWVWGASGDRCAWYPTLTLVREEPQVPSGTPPRG
ncbi:MAG: tetratricopeptide repeat protein [Pseudomonadota bacterium]